MATSKDATEQIRKQAASFPDVTTGASCNQRSFKIGKSSFLFIGPGAKGQGFKAMFKLDVSMNQARELAEQEPDRFQVGATGWVTVRFSNDEPLAKKIWGKWLRESYEVCRDSKSSKTKKAVKKSSVKKTQKQTAKDVAARKKSPTKVAKKKSMVKRKR